MSLLDNIICQKRKGVFNTKALSEKYILLTTLHITSHSSLKGELSHNGHAALRIKWDIHQREEKNRKGESERMKQHTLALLVSYLAPIPHKSSHCAIVSENTINQQGV